jgi:hypothetical protein
MDFRIRFFLGLVFCASAAMAVAKPAPAAQKSGSLGSLKPAERGDSLDQKSIHHIYSEGDFETVISRIDSFTATHKDYTLSDSIFIAKHLAVIYTANPATREKGKNYMFRLLNLMPSAKLVDMFVSDEIDHIFEKVREEYVVRQQSLGNDAPSHLESTRYAVNKLSLNPDSGSGSGPANGREDRPAAVGKGPSRAVYWIAGGVTLAAIAGAGYYFLAPRKSSDKTYDLPK